jgi:putative ABC transport system permease protein
MACFLAIECLALPNTLIMLFNYLKITFRNLLRYKLFSAINILGLSVSLASCLLLFLYAQQELSYDQSNSKNLYRLTSTLQQKDGELLIIGSSSVPIAPRAVADIPEVLNATRVTGAMFFQTKDMIAYEDQSYYIENGNVADTSIFKLFNFDIVAGNSQMPLPNSNAVALDKVWAQKIFGDAENAIGKMVTIHGLLGASDFEVTAVYDNSSILSHLEPSYIISTENTAWAQLFNRFTNQWVGNNLVFTYLELTPEADPEVVNDKIQQVLVENGQAEMEAMGMSKTMTMEPVTDIHTSSGYMMDLPGKVDLTFIKVLITIGALILILACFNYINLSTAQAGHRSLEVGIRKTMGVTTKGLMGQFLGESFLLVFISSIISILLAELALPFFNNMVETPIAIDFENIATIALFSIGFLFITAVIAGFYPAVYLSTFKPAEVLKGKNFGGKSTSMLRKTLVVLQFMISIILISAIIVIAQQVDYLQNKELGFTSKSKLVIPLRTEEVKAKYKTLKEKFSTHAAVNEVTGSESLPGSLITNDILLYKEGQSMEEAIHVYNNTVDLNYAQLLDIDLAGGSYFSDYNKDTTIYANVLINRLAAEKLNIRPEDAANKALYLDWQGAIYKFRVVGVLENINQFSLHEELAPLAFQLGSGNRFSNIIIDANMTDLSALTAGLEGEWNSLVDATPFEYFMLDDFLQLQYATDYNTFNLIKSFALISLIISCMGLYALSMFVAERRFKEIGVRKALGARVKDILVLVAKDLSILILIAFVISIPVSVIGMNKWLDTFAYRITPGIGIYIIAGLVSVGIGWLTISYQSFRAAHTNPVNVLRDE